MRKGVRCYPILHLTYGSWYRYLMEDSIVAYRYRYGIYLGGYRTVPLIDVHCQTLCELLVIENFFISMMVYEVLHVPTTVQYRKEPYVRSR